MTGLGYRVENLHLPFRQSARAMPRFTQVKTLQNVASVHAGVHHQLDRDRHLVDRQTCKERRFGSACRAADLVS